MGGLGLGGDGGGGEVFVYFFCVFLFCFEGEVATCERCLEVNEQVHREVLVCVYDQRG